MFHFDRKSPKEIKGFLLGFFVDGPFLLLTNFYSFLSLKEHLTLYYQTCSLSESRISDINKICVSIQH